MDMAPDSKELSQTDMQDLKARIGNLSQFLNGWKVLGKLTMPLVERGIGALPVAFPDQIPADVEKHFQELKELLLRMYPRVRPDVRKYAGTYSKTVPGPGGAVYGVSDYDPIVNLFNHAPTLFTLASSFAKPEDFKQDWSAALAMLNVTLGALQHALELGGERNLPSQMRPADQVVQIITAIRRALRKSFKDPPEDEPAVQDHMETIFSSLGFRFSRERERFSYSNKSYLPDFVFPDIGTVLEAKFCDKREKEKRIIAEINDDIVAYSTKYANLVFVVYDVGIIRDQAGFYTDIQENPNVIVEIVKH